TNRDGPQARHCDLGLTQEDHWRTNAKLKSEIPANICAHLQPGWRGDHESSIILPGRARQDTPKGSSGTTGMKPGRASNMPFEGGNSVFRGQCADEYAIRRLRSPKRGVQWHKKGPLMEQGEGQMGNVGLSLGPVPARRHGIRAWIFAGRVTLALKMARGWIRGRVKWEMSD
ncbi:hypothetical protein MYX77_07655, partial [Acidobacteriia bacterium AH_259_A11_L15]|nr:hypothetical protein [Acidobacteriia bacterium AH_259_A11_L15]